MLDMRCEAVFTFTPDCRICVRCLGEFEFVTMKYVRLAKMGIALVPHDGLDIHVELI